MPRHGAAGARAGHRWTAVCLLLLALCGVLAPRAAAAEASGAEALKAEVIYRALMFVTWPAEHEAGRRLQVCTAGDGRVEAALQDLAGRSIRQLAIEVRRAVRLEQLGTCHLVFMPEPQPAWRAQLERLPVLVVADGAGMLDHGVMLNLQIEDGRIVFDIDLDAARRAGLAISAKLLRLARYVRHQSPAP